MTTTAAAPTTTPPTAVTTTAPSAAGSAPVTPSEPVTTEATTDSSTSPGTTADLAPSTTTSGTGTTASGTGTSQTSTEGSTSTSPTAVGETTSSEQTSTAVTTSDAVSPTPSSAVQAEQVAKIEEPERLQASPQDVDVAKASVPVQQEPDPAPQSEIDRLRNLLNNPANPSVSAAPTVASNAISADWDRTVRQWQPDWVQYDEFYRPVIVNPYRDPLQIVYLYAVVPRILVIRAAGKHCHGSRRTRCALLHGDAAQRCWHTRQRGGGLLFSVAVMSPGRGCRLRPLLRRWCDTTTSQFRSSTRMRCMSRSGSRRSSMSATTPISVSEKYCSTA